MRGLPKAALVLADGRVFCGYGFGLHCTPDKPCVGEAVFNTSMYGYQEILTDPSYAGQIMCFSYPHIGNVGVNDEDGESGKVHVEGLVIRNLTLATSNFRARKSLVEYLKENAKFGITGLDTRGLVQHLRDHGAQMAAMAEIHSEADIAKLQAAAQAAGSMEGKNYVHQVSCASAYEWQEGPWELQVLRTEKQENVRGTRPHVVVLDCGVKENILRQLVRVGFRVTVLPAQSTVAEIESYKPDALFLSNGPGDPATLHDIVAVVCSFVGRLPIFGICLGHQILGQVFGGRTYKLKFGHRGGNHPVMDKETGKVEITVQNHGFAVDEKTLPPSVKVTHINLNDGTVEGIACPDKKVFSVQYHPEASSGPHDAQYLFERFADLVQKQGSASL